MSKRQKVAMWIVIAALLLLLLAIGPAGLRGRAIRAWLAVAGCTDCPLQERLILGVVTFMRDDDGGLGPLIIGGRETKASEYPTVGGVLYQGSLICTGTLLQPNLVLTAAHCFFDGNGKRRAAGDLVFTTGIVAGTGAPYRVDAVIFPPSRLEYRHSTHENDVALMRLASSVPFADFYSVAVSPDGLKAGDRLTFVAFGRSRIDGILTGEGIQRVVRIAIDAPSPTTFVYRSTTKNTCWGDSGGPALLGSAVVGVTSRGDRYCRRYGIDTRLAAHESWISGYVNP